MKKIISLIVCAIILSSCGGGGGGGSSAPSSSNVKSVKPKKTGSSQRQVIESQPVVEVRPQSIVRIEPQPRERVIPSTNLIGDSSLNDPIFTPTLVDVNKSRVNVQPQNRFSAAVRTNNSQIKPAVIEQKKLVSTPKFNVFDQKQEKEIKEQKKAELKKFFKIKCNTSKPSEFISNIRAKLEN